MYSISQIGSSLKFPDCFPDKTISIISRARDIGKCEMLVVVKLPSVEGIGSGGGRKRTKCIKLVFRGVRLRIIRIQQG